MAITALRQEIHSVIDIIPEHKLSALKPLLNILVEEPASASLPIYIETDLTEEEHTLIEEGVQHYRKHPEDFVPLENL
jgi:hypothetical protein